jgi:hypothetical protein
MDISAAERAQWLAELSGALDDARGIASLLELNGTSRGEALELYLRIEAARLEVQSLQLSRSLRRREELDLKWTESAAWKPA